jgi:SAM-dependent methyltransferase
MNTKHTLVQYGCGLSCPDGWHNYDVSPRLKAERTPVLGWVLRQMGNAMFPPGVKFGDIVAGLPHPEMSVDAIYCSHVLEHLDRESVPIALANTFRLLKPGGTFRLVVPDLTWRIDQFTKMQKSDPKLAADTLLKNCHLGRQYAVRGTIERVKLALGNSAHLWMYDEALISQLIVDVGFIHVRRCNFGDAQDAFWEQVEDRTRFEDNGHLELSVEAIKPT